MPDEQTNQLIARYIDGLATDAEAADLGRILVADPETAREFAEMTRIDKRLDLHFRKTRALTDASRHVQASRFGLHASRRRGRRVGSLRRSFVWWAAAAALLAAAGGAAIYMWNRSQRPGDETIAQLDVAWCSGSVSVSGTAVALEPKAAQLPLKPGDRIATGDGASRAAIVYPDGSRIELDASTAFVIRETARGRDALLERGALTANVVSQTAGPMVLSTRDAEVRVLGTRFRLAIEGRATRLEVAEGKVEMKRPADQQGTIVGSGFYALAGPDIAPVAMALGQGLQGKFPAGNSWHVAPDGKAENAGTPQAPWDMASAMEGSHAQVKPGDTIWLAGGKYLVDRGKYMAAQEINLKGEPGKPVVIRGLPGAHAVIDGGLTVPKGSAAEHVWIADLDVALSDRTAHGGVILFSGKDFKIINLVVRGSEMGIVSWTDALRTEIYGCTVFDVGYYHQGAWSGDSIAGQNADGFKTISNNIVTTHTDQQYAVLCYATKADVRNLLITGNIFRGSGKFSVGGTWPASGLRVLGNCFADVNLSVGGEYAQANEDCEVRDNVVIAPYMGIWINKFKREKVAESGNVIAPRSGGAEVGLVFDNGPDKRVIQKTGTRPSGVTVRLMANEYDQTRAHLAIYNWDRAGTVEVPFDKFLLPGDSFELRDPADPFGKPVQTGIVRADGKASVRMTDEFAAFIVLKK
jgi:ferric-dicitrate binding protein FerR (iron transport regulator)